MTTYTFEIKQNPDGFWALYEGSLLIDTFETREEAERYVEQRDADMKVLNLIPAKLEAWVDSLVVELGVDRQSIIAKLAAHVGDLHPD
jgi:hypothetical protein